MTTPTQCCVVGGGPSGIILSLALAKAGIRVTLLEQHGDFDRDFRGDTIHPSTLEVVEALGLMDSLQQLPHHRMTELALTANGERRVMAEIPSTSRYPYIMVMPQSVFLNYLVEEAKKCPTFQCRMGSQVLELIEAAGKVHGVRGKGSEGGAFSIEADLVVGCDGRGSRLRKLAGENLTKSSPPMDVLWFRLPSAPGDAQASLSDGLFVGHGHLVVLIERPGDQWQVGLVVAKGTLAEWKKSGVEKVQQAVARIVPALADRVHHFDNFGLGAMLTVECGHISRWHRPGLLLIGDAAHVMSPVGGIGIQYAVQDAISAFNRIATPLRDGTLAESHLQSVQEFREKSVTRAQSMQGVIQKQVVSEALSNEDHFQLPVPARIMTSMGITRRLFGKVLAHGFGHEPIRHDLLGR